MLPRARRGGADEPYFLRQTALELQRFRALLDELQRRDAVYAPSVLLDWARGGGWPGRPGVLVTFDDGYADVLEFAAPELATRGLSGLLCVTSAVASGTQAGFVVDHWYAAVASATARTGLLDGFDREPWPFDLDRAEDRARLINGPEKRSYLRASAAEQAFMLARLRCALGVPGTPAIPAFLDPAALAEMEQGGWILAAHGHRHALLPLLSDQDVAAELEQSKAFFAEHGLRAPVILAYPDGATCPRTEALARAAGFTIGLALGSRFASPDDPPLRLPRLIPTNDPDWFARRLLPLFTSAAH
ncbi:MAG: polysaccharide deacetylase family protein [Myxococcota bacterium]